MLKNRKGGGNYIFSYQHFFYYFDRRSILVIQTRRPPAKGAAFSKSLYPMQFLQWFGLGVFTSQTAQGFRFPADSEADRKRRYEYGVREVERWTRAKKAIAKDGAEMTRRFEATITEHVQKWGTEGEGLKILRWSMEAQQEQTEQRLQEAERRLSTYRNIVLMQGRI